MNETPKNPSMPENSAPSMVHESEAQRQHIRINLPASVLINGHHYRLDNWSVGGISINLEGDLAAPNLAQGANYDGVLHFSFDGFNINVPCKLHVSSATSKRVGCKFVEGDRNQRSIMQYFVTAYTSGELVNAGDLLDVVGRNNLTKPRNVPDPFAGLSQTDIAKLKTSKYIKLGIVGLISTLLVAYILSSIYQRLYIVSASSAQVSAEMLTVDSPEGGKIYYAPISADQKVRKGQPLLSVSTTNGSNFTVDSPCDCILKKRLLDNNRLTRKGEPALELVLPDALPFVEAYIPHKEAVKLSLNQSVMMAMPGHDDYLRGTITAIQAGKGMDGNSLITIKPNDPLPVEYVDDPVEIRIDTLRVL